MEILITYYELEDSVLARNLWRIEEYFIHYYCMIDEPQPGTIPMAQSNQAVGLFFTWLLEFFSVAGKPPDHCAQGQEALWATHLRKLVQRAVLYNVSSAILCQEVHIQMQGEPDSSAVWCSLNLKLNPFTSDSWICCCWEGGWKWPKQQIWSQLWVQFHHCSVTEQL